MRGSRQHQTVVDAYTASARGQGPQAEKKAAGAAVLDPALAEHPTDYFLLDRKRDLMDDNSSAGRETSLAWFRAQHQKYPDGNESTASRRPANTEGQTMGIHPL